MALTTKKPTASSCDDLPFSKRKQTRRNVYTVDEYKAITGKESDLQSQCENYLIASQIPFIRVPDAIYKAIFGSRTIPQHIRVLISSFIKGLPDLTILKKDIDGHNRALCVELKTAKGKLSQGQIKFASLVNVVVIRSFEDFMCTVDNFVNGGES